MSQVAIRAALEQALATINPTITTSYENVPFQPPNETTPYQACYVRFGKPENIEIGKGYNEVGYFQVSLFYPQNDGTADVTARAKLVRDLFQKKASFTSSGITVNVVQTPEIPNGVPDGDRWAVHIKIPFMAQIYS